MTNEERAALREEVENLTIKQARARGETATETLRVLAELGIAHALPPGTRIDLGASMPQGLRTLTLPSGAAIQTPTQCPVCGRPTDGTAKSFAECQLGPECLAMSHRQTNKPALVHTLPGPNGTAVVGDRAALLAQPAFGPDGEPT